MGNIPIKDANLCFVQQFFDEELAARYFAEILRDTHWHQQYINCFGKRTPLPRLTAWHGDDSIVYNYSGVSLPSQPWTATLQTIKDQLEIRLGLRFNGVLLNRYRDGSDSVSWHADDEKTLGDSPDIASVSLGASRRFQMKHRRIPNEKISLELTSGRVLLMRGKTQDNWLHQLPKTKKNVGERINLTFRFIHTAFSGANRVDLTKSGSVFKPTSG